MSRLTDIFSGRSLEAVLRRARQKLATGDFTEATRVVEHGLERFPEAEALREMHLAIRRVQARAGMQSLKLRIATDADPLAFEQLIQLYHEVDMPAEAVRVAHAYAERHPNHDSPHLLLGEIHLQSFFEHLQARDAHAAHDHLRRAARLNAHAIKPRLLLAELYFCVGANTALRTVGRMLERFDPEDEAIRPVLHTIEKLPDSDGGGETIDGLFAKVEVDGRLLREPTSWPLRNRRNREAQLKEERTKRVVERMVRTGEAAEVSVLRRNGTLMVHADVENGATELGDDETLDPEQEPGLAKIVRTVARTVSQQAREFDLGAFKRCSIQGRFGLVVVGRVSNVIAGAQAKNGIEPLRLWERLSVKLEGISQGGVQ